MAIIKMSVKDYAKRRGITRYAVTKALSEGHKTPGITSFEKFGNAYILNVDTKELKKFLLVSN